MTDLLFVYGSLRSDDGGPEAARLAAGSSSLGPAHARGHLTQLHGQPALVVGRGGRVDGELVHVTDRTLWDHLDAYEGVGEVGWYRRELVVVIDEAGHPRSAWAYTAAPSPLATD